MLYNRIIIKKKSKLLDDDRESFCVKVVVRILCYAEKKENHRESQI